MRLKALLIDDESNILKNLELVMPWEELQIDIVGLAKNGVAALELAKEHKPDIIFSDIRMPVMDGISFLEELRKLDQEAEVVMLTGYQDFEYARSVIRYGVRDYILKPINYDELTAVLTRIAGSIRAERQQRIMEEKRLGKAMSLAYEKLLYDILMGYSVPDSAFLQHDVERPYENSRFMMLLADFDDYSHKCRSSNDTERKLWNSAARNVLQEALIQEGLHYAVLQLREGEWCVLIELPQEASGIAAERARGWALILQQAVADNVKINLSIGVHPDLIELQQLPAIVKLLQKTVHLAADKDRSIILTSEEVSSDDDLNTLWKPAEELVSALKQNDRGEVEKKLERLQKQFKAVSNRSLARVEKMSHFIVLHLLREMRQLDVLSEAKEAEIWSHMEQAGRVKDMIAVIRQIVDESLASSMSKKQGHVMMHAAKDYIHRNLARDMSIDELSDFLGISSSYFSMLFKGHFGCTFVEYVTSERIELAKSLLLMTDKSVTEIGRSVGYVERRYFNKVFQKLTGEIPSEYREKRKAVH